MNLNMIVDPILGFLLINRALRKKKFKKINARFRKYVQNEYEKNTSQEKSALFFPDIPKEGSVIGATLKSLGYTLHNDLKKVSAFKIIWEDKTYKDITESNKDKLEAVWNSKCIDISKTYTDEIFAKIFGYSTRVNPKNHHGKLLEKNELNGKHEARITKGPVNSPKKGYIYQIVINNQVGRYLFEDIRFPYIKGQIPFCYLTYRLKGKRFSTKKYYAVLAKTQDVLKQDEIKKIKTFCLEMNVDYAEIDTLRDRDSNKLYIIDVNPTAFGPATGLSYNEKIEALDIYRKTIRPFTSG